MKFTQRPAANIIMYPMKLAAVGIGSALFGYLSTFANTLLAVDAEPGRWYESPAFTAAIAAGSFVVGARLVDSWLEGRREQKKKVDQAIVDNADLELERAKLTDQQWKEVVDRRDRLHAEQIAFLRSQHMTVEITKYELRERNHLAMDEVTKLQGYCGELKEICARNQIDFPAYPMKSYFQIMDGVDAKVEAYAEKLQQHYANGK